MCTAQVNFTSWKYTHLSPCCFHIHVNRATVGSATNLRPSPSGSLGFDTPVRTRVRMTAFTIPIFHANRAQFRTKLPVWKCLKKASDYLQASMAEIGKHTTVFDSQHVWLKNHQKHTIPMVKHGGSHTLWERFSPTGPGRLEMVVGKKKKMQRYTGKSWRKTWRHLQLERRWSANALQD